MMFLSLRARNAQKLPMIEPPRPTLTRPSGALTWARSVDPDPTRRLTMPFRLRNGIGPPGTGPKKLPLASRTRPCTLIVVRGPFSINSLTHLVGARRYATEDDSRNSFWLALATLGEGWHNNHHHYMSSTRQGFFWWEIDMNAIHGLILLRTQTVPT